MPRETRSKLENMTKDEIEDYADRKYGISLSTSDTKDDMINQFFEELANMDTGEDYGKQIENLQSNMTFIAVVIGILVILSLGLNWKVSSQLSSIQSGEVPTDTGAAPGNNNGGNDNPSPNQDQGAQRADVPIQDNDPKLGDSNAPVTIVEFADFECPFCKRYFDNAYPQIKENYVDTGKVRYVYKDFPLTRIHPMAKKAAIAAQCVYQIDGNDAFWEYHDMIFNNQNQLSDSSLKQWASDVGLNTNEFNSCFDNRDTKSEVEEDLSQGQSAGASGTPTFFINGKKIVGAQPYSKFKQAIESELN